MKEEQKNIGTVLFSQGQEINIFVSEEEDSSVHIAVDNLIRDVEKVCGCKLKLSKDIDNCQMVIGTLGATKKLKNELKKQLKNELPNEFADEIANKIHDKSRDDFTRNMYLKKLSLEKLKDDQDELVWEGFLQERVEDVFYIIGTNRRGTIYGIYDLCEKMGVSPWYYWADVPVKSKEAFILPKDFLNVDYPSVKYRGIFINDEEELNDWAKLHTPDGTIGPTTYALLFELLLRLKANYIWPAMHVNYFNENPKNGALAERMGVVIGTSHCDMLLRSNQNEWKPFIESKGYKDAVYDYSIQGPNREILKEYWRESVVQNKNYEVCFTMGMRGIHDSGFHTKSIDENKDLSEEEKKEGKVSLLGEVIQAQREILKEVLGEEKGGKSLQTFVPYKEVLELYNKGLDVPEDITLIWANDNFGHMRRYPNEIERKRKGGHGLYFHSSYWAAPGTAMSYLFINSIPLAQTGNELKKSYASGIQNIWVLNVGGLKPVEQDMEFFIRYGWDAGKEKEFLKDAKIFTMDWINANFSGNHGEEAAEIYTTFAQVTNVRKIEHMNTKVFSQTAYGDEAGRRLLKLEDIYRRGNKILMSLPVEERAGFFQLFLMKIHASYYTNLEYYYGDRSILSYKRGNMQAADYYVFLSQKMTDIKRCMLHYYDQKMSDGKWEKILTPESFPPPATAMHPAKKPALKIEGSSLRLELWNEENRLNFSVYGQRSKWIELGNQGEGNIPFAIHFGEAKDWLIISETEGVVETEKRILVSVKDPMKHAGNTGVIVIADLRNNVTYPIKIQIEGCNAVPEEFTGYVEADGYISIPAEGYQVNVSQKDTFGLSIQKGWIKVPGMGRYEGSAMMAFSNAPDRNAKNLINLNNIAQNHMKQDTFTSEENFQNPYLEYKFYLEREGGHVLELHRFLTLDSVGKIRLGIAIDEEEPWVIETETKDEWTGDWQDCIFNNGEKLIVALPHLSQGTHIIKIFMIDDYVTLSKLVIYTNNRKDTNLGPAYSMLLRDGIVEGGWDVLAKDVDIPVIHLEELEQLSLEFYHTKSEEVKPLDVLYAPKEFFSSEQVFNKCISVPQTTKGKGKYGVNQLTGGEKDIIKEYATGMFVETAGVIAIEAEYALVNSENAYITFSKDDEKITWSHLLGETCNGTGLVMQVEKANLFWEKAEDAPGMHYKLKLSQGGEYHLWLLLRHYNSKSDSCYFGVDGVIRPISEQFGNGKLHTYNTSQVYYWCHMTDISMSEGEHVLSILARKSELRIDRIYLTKGEELPPTDVNWVDATQSVH